MKGFKGKKKRIPGQEIYQENKKKTLKKRDTLAK